MDIQLPSPHFYAKLPADALRRPRRSTGVIALLLILCSLAGFSQEVEKIKVKKEDPFAMAEFDETNYRVIAMDKYGNPYSDVIKSFTITFQDTEGHFRSPVMGNTFPEKTIKYLTKGRKKATNLCLTDIVAEDKEGHVQKLPDKCGILIFPDCRNCDIKKKR